MPKLRGGNGITLSIEGIKVGVTEIVMDAEGTEIDLVNINPPRLRDALRFTARVHIQLVNKRFVERSKRRKKANKP